MPELSRFYGIVIYMYAKDHAPPHFHARYGDDVAVFDLRSGEVLEGALPRRATRLVQDWWELHQPELEANWRTSQSSHPQFQKIDPLQ